MLANILDQDQIALDYEQIARRALGGTWSSLTNEQQRAFLDRFSVFIDRVFSSVLVREDTQLRSVSERIAGSDGTLVMTAEQRRSTGPVKKLLACKLTKTHGRWLINDVIVNGNSLMDAYHDQLGQIIERQGFDALLARIQERIQVNRPH